MVGLLYRAIALGLGVRFVQNVRQFHRHDEAVVKGLGKGIDKTSQ